jgi:glycosyltransferase involved in cell wall biosynthesis
MDFCILIPYYNDLEGLITSLNSIRYDDGKFSVLIVDDGSDEPLDRRTLAQRLCTVLSIEIVRVPFNRGITHALNVGLGWLKRQDVFRYIARLDCGDRCHAERFYRQVKFMDRHPKIALLGSWCDFENESGSFIYQYRTPTNTKQIRRALYFRNVFIHPTVMWRASESLQYPDNFPCAEDYGLFYQLAHAHEVAILPQPLVTCRLRTSGLSLSGRSAQLRSRISVVRAFGENKALTGLGVLKIRLMQAIPYAFILSVKKILSPATTRIPSFTIQSSSV